MNKRLEGEYREFIYKGEKTPFSPGTLAVMIFCTVLLIAATFTRLDISYYWPDFTNGLNIVIKKYGLIPQIPVVLFVSAVLGARYGIIVILFYLITGFFIWPVFALGGGLEYIKSYFFGYILGFFAAIIFSGKILYHKYDIKNMLYAAIIGVLSIHICGIFYSFILSFFNFSTYAPNFRLMFSQALYDIIFSFLAILIAKPLKYIFWIAMKNEPANPKQKKEKAGK